MSTPQRPGTADPAHIAQFKARTPGSKARFEKAQRLTPGGISHFPRFHNPYPTYAARARGSHMWDVDGNDYIDLWMAHYDALLGHSPAPVVAALQAILADGLHVGLPMDHEIRLAELVHQCVPGAEEVRFCCSGTEADMYAVRLARAFTGRSGVLKMQGGFHGANSDLAFDVFAPNYQGPEGRGLLPSLAEYTHSASFNDIERTHQAMNEVGDDLAAVILEPVLGAAGFLPAEPDYLAFLREETRKRGALLIFDEVITGFRVSLGGAQEHYGITPDLTTMGKVMGGGMPIGAMAGRAEVLEISSVLRQVPQAEKVFIGGGTYSCNPLSMVAGATAVEILIKGRDQIYPTLAARAQRIRQGAQQAFDKVKIPVIVTGIASLLAVHFLKEQGLPLRNAGDLVRNTLPARQLELADRLRNHGVFMLHSGALSTEHGDKEVDAILAAVRTCAEEMAAAA